MTKWLYHAGTAGGAAQNLHSDGGGGFPSLKEINFLKLPKISSCLGEL